MSTQTIHLVTIIPRYSTDVEHRVVTPFPTELPHKPKRLYGQIYIMGSTGVGPQAVVIFHNRWSWFEKLLVQMLLGRKLFRAAMQTRNHSSVDIPLEECQKLQRRIRAVTRQDT